MTDNCPLCGRIDASLFHRDRIRPYYRCHQCLLVFVPADFHLPADEEKRHYDCHRNHPGDAGYRRFLQRLYLPLLQQLRPGDQGLDFGSGPGPTLSLMFAEAGFATAIYDIYYEPDVSVFNRQYDFITATEVVEHLARPARELDRLWRCLQPGGWLGLMTKLVIDAGAFGRWHYKNDPTHISFFSRETFVWLGRQWQVEPRFVGADVILFQRPRDVRDRTAGFRARSQGLLLKP